ncbi:MAG TPA: TetR/AcrR family transcriptional regulator [Kineosporiaceae bacterium]|nr:TetR/AcrR family transcriptional regulator [Kineosporiaceae bacterium]
MGRTSTAQDRLVRAAHELLGDRGYGSVGVAEICRRAEVQKGSFYHFYASKQALTIAVVNAHWDEQRQIWRSLLSGPPSALSRLERLLGAQVEGQRESRALTGRVSGCLLANLALELAHQEQAVTTRLAEIFAEQIDLVLDTLEQAVAEGSVAKEIATRDTAQAIVAQLEGMVLFAKLSNDPAVLDSLWKQVTSLIQAHATVPATI